MDEAPGHRAQGHLVHGMGLAWEAPTWPAVSDAEAAAVLARFPAAGRFERISWRSPRPFSAAAMIETDRGAAILKRHPRRLRAPEALSEEHALIAHLRAGGQPVPDVLATPDGASALALGDWTYELQRQAPGVDVYRDRQSWTPFFTVDHASAAGEALARLHQASRGFDPANRAPAPLVSTFTILPATDPLAAADAYVAARPAVAAFLADQPWRRELGRLFDALGPGLGERLRRQPRLWTHNDWHPSNLLWTPDGGVAAVIDFGLAAPTCALHDLATAIERSAIPWLDLRDGRIAQSPDLDAALALIAGYRRAAPLPDDDIETLVRLLPLVHIEFALSEIDYFAGVVGDHAQAMLAWRDYLLDHADWFLSADGQRFLSALRKGAAS